MKTGFITCVNAGLYDVFADNQIYHCRARGKFRIGDYSPIVGDNVTFDEKQQYLLSIEKRKNSLLRPPLANVEQVAIVASVTSPEIPISLINRFVVLSEIIHVKPIIILTKIDIAPNNDYLNTMKVFKDMGYEIYAYASKTQQGLEPIKQLMINHKTVFTGQSGVGKSSLINLLIPGTRQKTGDISKALGRGRHVTRVVEYLPYLGGWIADTPGFSHIEFDFDLVDLAAYYPGFEAYYPNCKFRNCVHDHETGCAVKKAVKEGKISQEYYDNYLALLNELRYGKEK